MLIKRIEGATRIFQAPRGWANETEMHCSELAIRDEAIDGLNFMVSAWEPTPDQLRRLACGAPVILRILGVTHPVVSLDVGVAPDVASEPERLG